MEPSSAKRSYAPKTELPFLVLVDIHAVVHILLLPGWSVPSICHFYTFYRKVGPDGMFVILHSASSTKATKHLYVNTVARFHCAIIPPFNESNRS